MFFTPKICGKNMKTVQNKMLKSKNVGTRMGNFMDKKLSKATFSDNKETKSLFL